MKRHFRNRHHAAWHTKWHQSARRRFLLVVMFCFVCACILHALVGYITFDEQLVYSFSTGLITWFLVDPMRRRLFPSETTQWTGGRKVWWYVAFGIALGFTAGTAIGDAYGGRSTFYLFSFAPKKLAGFVVMSIAVSLAFITFFYQQNRLQVMEQQATESKLQLLQSQLEPHMLFNTLANLRVLIDLDTARAQAMLDRIIDYLRATLGASRVTSHALSLEFDRLDDYLALMQIRMGERLRYTLDLPEALKTLPCPALILQPVVENAVLHGLEPSAVGGEILVTAQQIDKHLILSVVDTGLGFNYKNESISAESNSGFGLAQLRDRLATLYSSFASVNLESNEPSGTRVTIKIPITPASHETNHCPYC